MKMIAMISMASVAGAVLLTGCGAADRQGVAAATESMPAAPNPVAAEGKTSYPLALQNCGEQVSYPASPQRAVPMNQSAAEILIHLGVADRVVGTGYEMDAIPPAMAEKYAEMPQLSARGQIIKHEALLAAQPDFAYASFASFFTPEQTGTRQELEKLGISSYLTEFDCTYHEAVSGADFNMLFDEYRRMADIFDVPSQGEALIAEQQAIVDEGVRTAAGIEGTPKVMWLYSTFGGTPWAAGPGGLPAEITKLVGAENIFNDATTKWPEVSWDQVAERNPDIIIVADLNRGEPGDTAAEKLDFLKNDAVTSQLDAVKNNRTITIPGRYMDPSYGSAYAVPALAEGIVGLQ